MRTKWTTYKKIIGAYEHQKDLFLSLINEDGKIVSANANMLKTLDMKHPGTEDVNFYELLHPAHLNDFKSCINKSVEGKPCVMELYLRNGYYHPMKWQINPLPVDKGTKTYLCVGHKILPAGMARSEGDNKRLSQFNQLGEKNYQLIMEGLNAGILFQDKKGELISVNQKAAEILNTTLEKLYQLSDIENLWNTAWQITTEDGNPVLFEESPFMKALQTGQPQTEVLVIRLRNGDNRWMHFSSQPLFNNNAEVFSVVSNIVDVSPEKKLFIELEQRNALFKAFINQTPNLAWVVDEDSNLVFASQAFYQYFGLEEKKALNNKITNLIPGVIAANMFEKHMQVLETGKPTKLIEKAKWADGTNFVFHINIFPIGEISGKKLLGGHAVNLAGKYETEQKLRETNERLLLLTRATSDAIWEWDMQSGQIFRNDALMDMIGYNAGAPKGLSWWLRRIHPDDRNRVGDKVKESSEKNQQSWQDEYLFKCADGNYKRMRDKGYIVYENGLPVKMIGSLQDISNIRDLESQLMTEKLERQKEISETIIHAQEKERTRIGHELHDNVNQILSTTRLFVDMLTPVNKEEKGIKEKSIEYLTMALEEIRKLSKELVVPQLRDKDLVESIEVLIEDIHFSTSVKIKFTHDYENDFLSPGKQVTLLRIVQEQLKNILKHSQAKKVDILLQSKEGNTRLIIKDNGVGFSSKQTHQGIGLSNIFERARFYNGAADIETAPGKGCTLIVTVPSD